MRTLMVRVDGWLIQGGWTWNLRTIF